MSQFDFPRINFAGSATINPATGNNNLLLPLVIFDAIQVKAVLPPRIYCNAEVLSALKLGVVKLPAGMEIQNDKNERSYFEIYSVNTPDLFKQWASTPLGNSAIDEDFHHLYKFIKTERGKEILEGKIPGGWNYFGGMEFSFHDVSVASVTFDNSQKMRFTSSSSELTAEVKAILNAKIDLTNKRGVNSAVIIDVIPNISFYSQIFCDSLRMIAGDKELLIGKPTKASLRFLNPSRIVNQHEALGSSGTFYWVLPTENIEEGNESFLQKFIQKHSKNPEKVKGIFMRFDLFEVEEDLFPDYVSLNGKANPATCKVVGSMSPWLEGDMKSITMARFMVPENPFYATKTMGSFPFKVDVSSRSLILDLIGSIPEIKDEKKNTFQTYDLGKLQFLIEKEGSRMEIAAVTIGSATFNAKQLIETGGILEIPIHDGINLEELTEQHISVYGSVFSEDKRMQNEILLMRESEWMLATDASGLYINQFENAAEGYRTYSEKKEACELQIYRFGRKIDYPIPMFIKAFRVSASNAVAEIDTFLSTNSFSPKTALHFPTENAGNHMYILYPGTTVEDRKNPVPDIVKWGFLINLRILPKHDYGKYLDPNHPEYPTPISFELVYQELLEVSNLIYPQAALITPFTEKYFRRGWPYIKTRMKPENWSSYSYMPSSRDMSDDLYRLICKWGEGVK